jgi:hypothetical protein
MANQIDAGKNTQRTLVANTAADGTGSQVFVTAAADGALIVDAATVQPTQLQAQRITVADTGSQFSLGPSAIADSITILNEPGGTSPNDDVYVGPNGVAVATGFKLVPGASINLKIDDWSKVWLISNTGQTPTVMGIWS